MKHFSTHFLSLAAGLLVSVSTLQAQSIGIQQVWATPYTNSKAGDNNDVAKDVAVDAAGNVYVTGYSLGSDNLYDFITTKYSANGQQLWEARYNEPGSHYDKATSVVVDAAGNVYVTGASHTDYVTIKYSTIGQQLWTARYNGPGNGNDEPTDLVLDAAGNVYVTGASVGAGSGSDYATLKYDGVSGKQLWVTRYNGAGRSEDQASSLALDAAGNVYVTGSSYGYSDYVTLKYSATGQQLWEARYNGISNGGGSATDMAVDAASNVYVTGYSFGSSTGYDYVTVKYSVTGQQQWASRYNGTNGRNDWATNLAVDAAGNVFVTGRSYSGASLSSSDYATLKYSANGQQLWEARYNGSGNGADVATDLAVDAAGNAYVTGYSDSSNSDSYDYATLKYAATSGQQLWHIRYNGDSNGVDQANSIVVDAAGNVYVTGSSVSSGTNSDYITVKYAQTGSSPLAAAPAQKSLEELAVYPNPTATQATVSFRALASGAAQVQVYNQLGQQVATLYQGTVSQGQRYTLPLNSQTLASGLYTCSLLVNGQRESVRLHVAH
ncbi:SBBP repeat-containing protein [Hymenobacter sp. YC55]|uniref:SBBP repeat-containing protein n=1 Tax=Hymenobacter sp. YC55 TaxID=3034019 RepID=UPI0023F8B17D|nr:SBBP repeat-containing protein [Hymenobacter sp. YC55]MDF7812056.1 SBBP repeat-containing protein [Hymenobacter sp. YC55]